jgi:hypothetical protein
MHLQVSLNQHTHSLSHEGFRHVPITFYIRPATTAILCTHQGTRKQSARKPFGAQKQNVQRTLLEIYQALLQPLLWSLDIFPAVALL